MTTSAQLCCCFATLPSYARSLNSRYAVRFRSELRLSASRYPNNKLTEPVAGRPPLTEEWLVINSNPYIMDGLSVHKGESLKTNIWALLSIIFLVWAVGASVASVNYYQIAQKQQTTIDNLQSIVSNVAVKANIAINYGNGTTIWYNDTYIPIGWSLFNLTGKLCTVKFTEYPSLGIWINSINGVSEDPSSNKYWIWYVWSSGAWNIGPVGADQYIVKNGDILKWELTKF